MMISIVPNKTQIAVGEIQTIEGYRIKCFRHFPTSNNILWDLIGYDPTVNDEVSTGTVAERDASTNQKIFSIDETGHVDDGKTFVKSGGVWSELAGSDVSTLRGTIAERNASSAATILFTIDEVANTEEHGNVYTQAGGAWVRVGCDCIAGTGTTIEMLDSIGDEVVWIISGENAAEDGKIYSKNSSGDWERKSEGEPETAVTALISVDSSSVTQLILDASNSNTFASLTQITYDLILVGQANATIQIVGVPGATPTTVTDSRGTALLAHVTGNIETITIDSVLADLYGAITVTSTVTDGTNTDVSN